MMSSLASLVVRRRRAVILMWIVLLIGAGTIGSSAFSVLSSSFGAGPSTESGRVKERLDDLAETGGEIAIIAEVQSSARHIYLDGRGHPDIDVFDPTTNGHSIGHWEGQTLVVETVGFNDRGNLLLPGGGARTPSSKLIEHYELLAAGKQLKVTFTWEDPQIFTQPHTYFFMYYKSAADQYAREYFCDASDTNRSKTAEQPTQQERTQ